MTHNEIHLFGFLDPGLYSEENMFLLRLQQTNTKRNNQHHGMYHIENNKKKTPPPNMESHTIFSGGQNYWKGLEK